VIINQGEQPFEFEEELSQDVLRDHHCFSARCMAVAATRPQADRELCVEAAKRDMKTLRAYKTELDLNNTQKQPVPVTLGGALGLQLGFGSQDGSLSKWRKGSNRDRPAPGS